METQEDLRSKQHANTDTDSLQRTFPKRTRHKPKCYGFAEEMQTNKAANPLSNLNKEKESLQEMVETLKETGKKEINELESLKTRMAEFEKQGRRQQELLEHISVLLMGQSTNQPQSQNVATHAIQEEAPSLDPPLPSSLDVNNDSAVLHPATHAPDANTAQAAAFVQSNPINEPQHPHEEVQGAEGGFEPPGGANKSSSGQSLSFPGMNVQKNVEMETD